MAVVVLNVFIMKAVGEEGDYAMDSREKTALVLDQSRDRWKSILPALGLDSKFLSGKHGPCPLCGGKDRFRFDDKGGRGTYYCNSCGNGDGMDLLMKYRQLNFIAARTEVAGVVGDYEAPLIRSTKRNPRFRIERIAEGARPLTGDDPASSYLKARGLSILPDGLKYHSAQVYVENGRRLGKYAAMVAPVLSSTGQLLTYHLTYLQNGVKAPVGSPRKIMPSVAPISGGAVRLFPAASHIGIAEGIETAVAARELFDVPVWAVLSTSGMKSFEPPEGVEMVTIYADNDVNGAGQSAAYHLESKLTGQGGGVEVEVPKELGTDFLNQLVASVDGNTG